MPGGVSVPSVATACGQALCWLSGGIDPIQVSSLQQRVEAEEHLSPWNRQEFSNYHFVLKYSKIWGTLATPTSFFPWLLCGQCCYNFSVQIKSVESHKKRSGPWSLTDSGKQLACNMSHSSQSFLFCMFFYDLKSGLLDVLWQVLQD